MLVEGAIIFPPGLTAFSLWAPITAVLVIGEVVSPIPHLLIKLTFLRVVLVEGPVVPAAPGAWTRLTLLIASLTVKISVKISVCHISSHYLIKDNHYP
jgi:hypothetical protein